MYHINKIQKYNFTLKTKQGRDNQIIISKGPFFLNMFPKNKQYNKLRQTKKNEIKEEIYLNYTIVINYAYFFLIFCFRQIKLLNVHKKCVSLSVTIVVQKRCGCFYRVFSCDDLALLFYSIYFCFILDLRRDSSKHNCAKL